MRIENKKFNYFPVNFVINQPNHNNMDEILDEKNYENRTLIYASFLQRFIALISDILIIVLVSYGYFLVISPFENVIDFYLANWWKLVLISTLYFIYFEGSESQATLGKQIVGIRLLTTDKSDIDFKTSVFHFILSVLLFPGFFRILLKSNVQTFADKLCKVWVIVR